MVYFLIVSFGSDLRILDGLAGLWSVNLGYNQERLVAAATNQMRKLPYYHSFWNQEWNCPLLHPRP